MFLIFSLPLFLFEGLWRCLPPSCASLKPSAVTDVNHPQGYQSLPRHHLEQTESVRGGGCPEQTLGTLPSLCPLNSVRPSAVTFQLFPEECELLKSGTACVECSMRPLLSLSSSRSHSCSAGCQLNGLQGSFLRSSFLRSSLLLVSSDPVCPSEEYLPASKGQLV